jgi:hypothetical protein
MERLKVASEIDPFILQSQFCPEVIPVGKNGILRDVQDVRYLFGGLAILYEICNLDLRRGKANVFIGQLFQERRCDSIYV